MSERIQNMGNEFSTRMRALNWGALGAAMALMVVGLLLIAAVHQIVGLVVIVAALVVMWRGGWYPTYHSAEAISDE